MSENYQPTNWYWSVAGSATASPPEVWSSANKAYVGIDNATYQSWLAEGNVATDVDTNAELIGVLNKQFLDGTPSETVVAEESAPSLEGSTINETRNKIANPSGSIFWSTSQTRADRDWSVSLPWYLLVETGSVTNSTGSSSTPLGILPLTTNVTRAAFVQKIDATITPFLQGQPAYLSFIARSNVALNIKCAVLTDNLFLTRDDVVNNWSSTTYTAGNFFRASLNVDAVSPTIALAANVVQLVELEIPTLTDQYVIVIIWTEDQLNTSSENIFIGRVQFEQGSVRTPHTGRHSQLERVLALNLDDTPNGWGNYDIQSGSLPAAGNVDIIFTPVYSSLLIYMNGASHNSGASQAVGLLVSTDFGATWAGAGQYQGLRINNTPAAAAQTDQLAVTSAVTAAQTLTLACEISFPFGGCFCFANWWALSGTVRFIGHSSYIGSASAINGLRLYLSGGSFDAGTYQVFGRK